MNRYKSDDTCEALGVARALPAPAGHLWELSSGRCLPSAFLSYRVPPNYPHKCICAAAGDLTGLRTVCSANWREDCWSEETEIWPRKWSLYLKHRTLVLSELNLNIMQPVFGILYPVWPKKENVPKVWWSYRVSLRFLSMVLDAKDFLPIGTILALNLAKEPFRNLWVISAV